MAASSRRKTGGQTIWTIAWHEYITNLRRPGFIFFTLLIPALGVIGLIIAAFFSGQALGFLEDQFDSVDRPVGVVDQSGLYPAIPPEFADQYLAYPDEASARGDLLAEELSGFIVIHADYVETGAITAYSTGGFFAAANVGDSGNLRGFLVQGLVGDQLDPVVAERVADPSNVSSVTLDETGQPTTQGNPFADVASFIIPYILSIFLIISIFTSSSYLLRSVSEEKESRVIEVVLSSVPATQLLAGKVLGLGALGLTQVLVWLASSFLLSGGITAIAATVVVALNPVAFALSTIYVVLGFLLYGTLMAAAGALGTSMRDSQQLASIFSFASAVPLMFNSLILANPDSVFVRVLSLFPLTSPTAMMLRLPLSPSMPWLDIVLSLVGLFITIPLVLWAGAKVFRMGLLLYGKRPGVKQILRALRQA
jgi:ABC-2 type transport system permease protein